mgnify:FL=1
MTIIADRLERFLTPDIHLRACSGKGANGTVDVCVMQAVDWLAGGDGKTDAPPCASRVITRYCVRLNDSALFALHRDLLKPYAPKIVGTRDESGEIDRERGFMAADRAVRVFAPIVLRAAGREEWAAELEACAPITDATSARLAHDAVRKIRGAADDAYDDAAAYADAYAAAAAAGSGSI